MIRAFFHSRILALASLLVCAAPSYALTVRCAGTVQQLAAALDEANASTDTAFIIRLREGTYDAGQAPQTFALYADNPDQVVELSGGWSGSGGTCQTRSFDPSLTVLVGTATRGALLLGVTSGATATSTVYVNDLTLRNPAYTGIYVACLSGTVTAPGELRAERLRMEQCMAQAVGAGGAGSFDNNGGVVTLRDVSVRNSRATNGGGFLVQTHNGTTNLSQLSITTAEAIAPNSLSSGLYVQNYSNSITNVSNSVIWGNDPTPATADIYVFGSGIHFTRVHYGSLSGTPASNVSPGTGDPGFVAAGDAHLRADSLLIDSGIASPPGGLGLYDADGNTRVRGAAVDVGAFESAPVSNDTIFKNDFE